ncbi:MAG TPA: acetate--CoA ligase family protein [Acetobacteraceae bacterium]|nr:acetate--CoA ligase family protein [Acetobacteraceae bacterium]
MPTQRTTVYRHAELRRLLHPQSVAVIGASARPGSFGERVLLNQQNFAGRTYPVNARYDRIGEQTCYPSVGALPEVPDCAVITAARDAVEEIVLDCARAGVGGVIIFASGYAEMGREDRIAAQDRLAAIARETGLRIVGPNCIGVVNAVLDSRITFMNITPIPPPRPHAVGIISQSGALGMALAQAVVRGASFSHVMTSGNSCDVDTADFVSYLADDPACTAIACVFEGMASPERLLLAAEYAWQRDKPLVVYKMATGEEGAAAAMSHTGSLAGSHAAYRAVFQRAGAVLVESYESLVETASFFAKAPPPKARGAAVVAASGGAAIMAADRAEQYGVPLPQPGAALLDLLVSRIPDFGAARNPCDVTGQILNDPESLNVCAGAFLDDPQYATLVVPMTYGFAASAARIPVYDRLAKAAGKIVCIAWQTEWLEGPGVKEAEESDHVALFRSMAALFAALAAWTWRADKRAAARETITPTPAATRRAARDMIAAAAGRTLTEREAKAALALYGVPVVGERLAASADAAVAAAAALGYPVVLKVESPDLPHKTEAGVIRLNLCNADEVRAGYDAVMANAGRVSPPPRINGVLVQPMVPQGVEMVVGARIDKLFGPLVVVGLGGILVEVLQDTALAPAPVTHADASALLRSLKGEKLLHGFRGAPAVDLDKLADVICRISRFAADHRDLIAELDVNPLICAGERIIAVDALIVPAPPPAGRLPC